jgi:glycosyltransferase involved in cell wall biosynthesis
MSCKITILIPAFNGMPYLRDAIQSLMEQTERNWRCVVVNDGSTDGTREFLDSIRDDRFIILHQKNAGIAAAINRGLQHCHTPYIARLDADDVALPTRLARQLAYLECHPDVGLVGTQVAPLGERGSGKSLCLPLDHDSIYSALADGRHAMVHSTIMGRTALFEKVGGYWSLPTGEEYDLMLRIGEISRLANLDDMLLLWRVHEKSLTGRKMAEARFYIDYACELGRRRRTGTPPISSDEFRSIQAARPWWRRRGEAINIQARCQYRIALAELHSNHRWRGSVRMAWAAFCAPRLTFERITRIVKPRPALNGSIRHDVAASELNAPRDRVIEVGTAHERVEAVGGVVR